MWIAGTGGIYRVKMDEASGRLEAPEQVADIASGSWLVTHPKLAVLYASYSAEAGGGGVAAFRFDETGALEPMGTVLLPNGSPTHIAISPDGRFLATAHYGGGAVNLIELRLDGGFADGEAVVLRMPFRGNGPKAPQTQARPHWVGFSPDGTQLLVPDLGNDVVWTLAVDAEAGGLSVASQVELPRGTGPRHLAVHPSMPWAYVTGELGSSVAQLRRGAAGVWERAAVWPSLGADDDAPTNNTSEVLVHPSGRFLYVGNRGHDTIGGFAIDDASGALTPVEREPVRGSWPRNFGMDPSGRWLIAAGQHSGTLSSFAIDSERGALRFSLSVVNVPAPVRVLFVP